MVGHQWEAHGDGQHGSSGDYHRALAWIYGALDRLPGNGWGMLRTVDSSCWRAERDETGKITWTRL